MNGLMDLLYVSIAILPFILIILIAYLIYDVRKNKRFFTKSNGVVTSIIIGITLFCVWYYFPDNNILGSSNPESVSIYANGISTEIKNEDEISSLLKTINQNTYYRNATNSVGAVHFPSENLIRIDLIYHQGDHSKVVHVYVLTNFSNTEDQALEVLSKGNALQIDAQFYSIKDTEALSKEIYELLMSFGYLKA